MTHSTSLVPSEHTSPFPAVEWTQWGRGGQSLSYQPCPFCLSILQATDPHPKGSLGKGLIVFSLGPLHFDSLSPSASAPKLSSCSPCLEAPWPAGLLGAHVLGATEA